MQARWQVLRRWIGSSLVTLVTVLPLAGQTPPIPGDLNGDADVDSDDFTVFLPCVTGTDIPYRSGNLPAGCTLTPGSSGVIAADCDRDGDVDQDDFALIQRCFSGSNMPANPGCATGTWQPMPGDRQWAKQALTKECDYIADCSYTEYATNHTTATSSADGYGVLNDNRIASNGPDWVRPGEAAMGAIGLMAGAQRLYAMSADIGRYDRVLDRFFQVWILQRRQPILVDTSGDRDAICSDVDYDSVGTFVGRNGPNAAVTGQLIVAMWKYGRYKRAIGQAAVADQWLQDAWPIARAGGEFIARQINDTRHLVRSNSTSQDLWITDGVFATAAMRVLEAWSSATGQAPPRDYSATADSLSSGVAAMADYGAWRGFFRYRRASGGYTLTYGDQIDQLCFLPYESGVLDAGDDAARLISDFWTLGDNGSPPVRLTPYSTDAADWRYFGTHLHHYFDASRPENRACRLARGSNWLAWNGAGPHEREMQRVSNAPGVATCGLSIPLALPLWYGTTGEKEAGVGNGIVDWRRVDDRTQSAQPYERFLDTSGYFIETTLMLYFGTDTAYLPG